jgi:hypothetical protein
MVDEAQSYDAHAGKGGKIRAGGMIALQEWGEGAVC